MIFQVFHDFQSSDYGMPPKNEVLVQLTIPYGINRLNQICITKSVKLKIEDLI